MRKKILWGVLAIAIIFVPAYSFGATFEAGESVFIEPSLETADNLYIAGSDVNMAGPVAGDIFAAGGNVTMTGPVAGDLLVAGGTLNISGSVSGDTRVLGGNVTVSNPTGGELIILGGQLNITAGSITAKDAELAGGNINYGGEVAGDLSVNGEKIYINGKVAGNLSINAIEITLGPNAQIGGNFEYTSPEEAVMEDGATVAGAVTFHQDEKMGKKEQGWAIFGFITLGLLLKLLSVILLALLALHLWKRQTNEIVDEAALDFWKKAGLGFIILVVTPIAAIIGFVTLVGIPLGLIALLSYLLLLAVSCFMSVLVFARLTLKYVFKKEDYALNWWIAALSALVLSLISFIPIVGGLFTFILFLSAFGSVSKHVFSKLRE